MPQINFIPSSAPKDFALEVARGNISGVSAVSKFGSATDCDAGVATDVWDGADGTTSTDIWVAPTQARVHAIASTSANDDGDPVGTGMRTLRVYGLKTWASAETSEDITLNGTTGVNTANSYVIIHRMLGLTFGSGGKNAGIITATAATDATVTAAIQAGKGQTLMAIYGVPSTQTFKITHLSSTALKTAGGTVEVAATLFVKENADQADSGFVTKRDYAFAEGAPFSRPFDPPLGFSGPCIVKVQANSDTDNATITADFDGYLVNN